MTDDLVERLRAHAHWGMTEEAADRIEAQAARIAALEAEVAGLRGAQTQAARDVLVERQRQITAEGWTAEHDNQYDREELSAAAACYAYFGWVRSPDGTRAPTEWPWDVAWWKPTDRRRDLVRAGALILAEIERLDRALEAKE